MAFDVIVFFVPGRARRAHALAMGTTAPQDSSVAPPAGAALPATWQQPPTFKPWPVTVQFTGSLPEGTAPAAPTEIETPPSWSYRPFPRPWVPRQVWTVPPGDDTFIVLPDTERTSIPRRTYRDPFDSRRAAAAFSGTPAYDDSVTLPADADPVGNIPTRQFQNPYRAVMYIGAGAMDDTLELDNTATVVQRPPFRQPYNATGALRHAFSRPGDDTLDFGPQEEAQATVVRNTFRQPYNPRAALIAFSGSTPGDDTDLAALPLTGGIYLPVMRRRRR
jgi:hypothetical protein